MPNFTFKTLTHWQENYQLNFKMHSSLLSLVLVLVSFQVIQSAPIPEPKPFLILLGAHLIRDSLRAQAALNKYEDIKKKDQCLTSAGYGSSGLSNSGGSGGQTGTGGSSSGGSPPPTKNPFVTKPTPSSKVVVDLKWEDLFCKLAERDELQRQIWMAEARIGDVRIDFATSMKKLDDQLTKLRNSRPRGNAANHWPHVPMSDADKKFWEQKEKKERELDAEREVLVANRDGFVAVEQAHINQLTERKSDTETIIKILRNMFKNKLGPDGKELK